ncbi:MAG: DUF885 family protein [Bacteroidota bacterium]
MKSFNLTALILFFLSCSNPQETKSPSQSPADFFEEYYEAYLRMDPLTATFLGDFRFNDTLPNELSEAVRAERIELSKRYLEKAKKYHLEELNREDALSMRLLTYECELQLKSDLIEYPEEYFPINQMRGFHSTYGTLASGRAFHPFRNTKDYEDWLSRLEDYIPIIDTCISNMRKGISEGYVLPTPLIEKLIPQLESLATLPVEENVVYSPIKIIPDSISPEDRQRLASAYKEIGITIINKFQELTDFVKTDYRTAGRSSSGIGALKNGDKWYKYLIENYTTTDLTADEVFDIGMNEVKRIREEMEWVKDQVGYKGSLISFFDFVRENPELKPFDDPQQVIDNFYAIYERVKPEVESIFNIQPKTQFEVRRTEKFKEATASNQYWPGSLDGSRPGIFYVPIPDVTAYNVYRAENLFLHEAIPGHHFQISIQRENQKLPKFRRMLFYGSYVEGWGLYTESLGKELGLYKDPYQYFGMLSSDMHRAIRLVVDAGIHVKGWTRDEAIQFSLDNEAASRDKIIKEIERYMARPGQALSYKVGQLKILELRKKAEEVLGERFDIKGFHDTILLTGSVPLSILEEEVDAWIREVKGT